MIILIIDVIDEKTLIKNNTISRRTYFMINKIWNRLKQINDTDNRGIITVAIAVLAFLVIDIVLGVNIFLHNLNYSGNNTLFIDYVSYIYLIFIPCWIYFVEKMMPDTDFLSEIGLKIAGEILGFICIVLSFLNNYKSNVVEKTAELTVSLVAKYISLINTYLKTNNARGWIVIVLSVIFALYLFYIFIIRDMTTATGIVIKNLLLLIISIFVFDASVGGKEISTSTILKSTTIFILLLVVVNLFIYNKKEDDYDDYSLLDEIVPTVDINNRVYTWLQVTLLVIAVCLYAFLFISHRVENWSSILSMIFEETGSDINETVENMDSYGSILLFVSFFVAMLVPGIFLTIEKATHNSILLKINNILYTFAAQIFFVDYISNKLISYYSVGMLEASPFTYILTRPVQVFLENLKEKGKLANMIFWIIIFVIIILAIVWYVCITLLCTYGITIFLSYILVSCFAYSIISVALPILPVFSYMIIAYLVNIVTSNITSRAIVDTFYAIKSEHYY